MRSGPRRRQPTRALAAALCAAVSLAPAAAGADATQCPVDSPLGGWVRVQHFEHQQPLPANGCEEVVNVYLTFDLVPDGPSIEWYMAHLSPQLPPQIRQQMLTVTLARQAFGGRAATKIKYWMWSDGCHDIGGKDFTCKAPGGRASGELTIGEETPTGVRGIESHDPRGDVRSLEFDPLIPDVGNEWGLFWRQLPPRWHVPSKLERLAGRHLLIERRVLRLIR